MLGPFATASRYIAIHQVSLLSHAACASMSTTTTTTTTTTRDRGDRYGPIKWAQSRRRGPAVIVFRYIELARWYSTLLTVNLLVESGSKDSQILQAPMSH